MRVLYIDIDSLRPDHLGCYSYHRNTSCHNIDLMISVLQEGGPFQTRGELLEYLKRLETSGRSNHAQTLAELHPTEI